MADGRGHSRTARGAVLAALLALAAPVTAAGPAHAAPAPDDRSPRAVRPLASDRADRLVRAADGTPVGRVRAAATTAAAQRAVRAYWTPARMRAARPYVVAATRVPATAVRVAAGGRATRPPSVTSRLERVWRSRGATVTGRSWPTPSTHRLARTTGKVFFHLDSGDYVCSGSAVSSPDASTVLTAGHCVNEGGDGTTPGAYATSWVFVPGYRTNGTAPYGQFVATHLATTTGWRTGPEDFDDDVGFANVGRNASNRTLGQAVGGQAIDFGRARGEWVTALGYPAADPFDGEHLTYCRGYLRQDTYGGSPDQGLRCDMTPGSSGGPWVADLDPATGRGTLVSVTSFSYVGLDGYLWGTYLGTTAENLYDSVASTTGA